MQSKREEDPPRGRSKKVQGERNREKEREIDHFFFFEKEKLIIVKLRNVNLRKPLLLGQLEEGLK